MAIKFLSAVDHGAYQLPTVDGSSGQVLTTDGNGNVTFQSVAASANYYLSGASFNTGTGVLTLTVSGAANQTVDLDGRYALSSHTHSYDNYQSWNLKTNGVQRTTVQSGGTLDLVAGSNVSLSYSAGGVVTINSSYTNTNYYVDGLSFDTGTGILTASVNGTTNRTVDLDGRYLLTSGKAADSNLLDGIDSSSFLRSDTTDTATGALTFNGNVTFNGSVTQNGVNYGLYHSNQEDAYYFDDYNGSKYLNIFHKNAYSDILRYQPIDNLEYWNGSSWVDMSSQLSNVQNLLDGRKDTGWNVPSTYYKFRFTITASTSWPTRSMIWLESSWTGSSYPGCTLTIEENVSGTWTTRSEAVFTSANGVGNWGLAALADGALHTGYGAGGQATRITVDFYGWSPSNPSYTTIPLQNIMVTSQFSGSANTDYSNLLNYSKNLTAPAKLYISTVDSNTSSTSALVLNGTEVEQRTLGSNAFNSTAYNPTIGTDTDINTSGADVIDYINVTDGVITSMGSRTLTLAALGFTGDTNANYITNNNQLTNGAGYITDGNTNWNNTYGFITASSTDTLTNKSGNISMFTNDAGYITDGNTGWNNSYGFITASSTDTLTNKSGNISQWTNDSGYITSYVNTTYSAGSGLSLSGTTFSHADTSSQSSVNNSGRTYIQDITLDTYGHVTAITSATETVTNTDTITRVGTASNETTGTITLVAGGATTISQSGGSITISSTDTNTDTNNYLTGASFSTSNGVLTLTRQGLGDITVDLDGRFTDNGYADALNQHLRTSDSPSFAGMTINGNLTVTGTTITDQVEVVSTSTGILFEGSAADAYEGLLLAGTLTADRTYTLPNATGTVALTSDIPTVNNATLTVQGTGALGGSGTFTANASSNVTISISHDDTSTLSGAYGGSNNGIVIEDITVDGYGHVTAIGTRDLDGRFDNYGGWRISDSATSELIGAGDTLTVTGAGATTVSYDAGTNTLEITSTDTNTNTTYSAGSGLSLSGTTFSHSDTSSASSVNNSGRTYIQDITIDTYGHVTAIASATETVTNTDTNYYVTGASFNTGNGIVTLTRNDGGTVTVDLDGRYQAAGSYAYYDHFRSLGVPAFTAGGGSNSTITTDQLIAEMEGDGAFDSYTSAFKTSWSYAGNDNLTGAGNFTETAGTSWLTWTDNSSDSSRGNITALAIAPNSGGSAYGVYIYNDQGSGYSPGWREIWTDKTLNPIVSATVSNDTTTYVKADGTSFSLTTSDANSNTYVTGASFNTGDGVLTLTRNSGSVTVDLDGRYQLSGTYNTIIGTDTDINTSGSTIIDNIYVTDGVITSMGTRTLTLADLGYTGATNADAYGSWRISDGTNSESLGSGATLTVTGTGATTASYDAASNTLTINSTDTNTNTTYSAGSGLSLSGTTFSHSDTSSQSSVNNSGRTYIQDITLDTYGHVTGITSATETVTNTDTVTRVGTSGLEATGTVTFVGAGATSITQVGNTVTVTSTDTNTNTTYSAGNGIGLSGTTFSVAAGAGLTQDASGLSLTSGIVTAGTYGSTSNQTKVDTITVDTYGRVTGVTTGATGDITGVTAGTGLSGGGSSGTVTVNLSHLGLESLADPNADRVAFWDDSAGAFAWLTMGSNLSISGTTLNATDTNTDTTYSAGSGLSLSGTTFSHTDTSSQASVNNSGNTVIQDVTLDTYGHVTGLASKTLTLSGLGYTGASNADLYNYWTIDVQGQQSNITSTGILNIQGTGATNVTYDPVAKMVTIDSTDTNTNTTYSADGNYGLTLSGTTFRLENDRRRNATGEDVWSGNTHDYTWYDASVGIRWYTAAAEEMRLTNGGDLHVDGDVIAYSSTVSDRTFKDDINTISDALDKIKKLRGVEYVWNTGSRKGKKDLGLIAQEVEEVLPEIVHEHEMPLMEDAEAGKTYKTVDYEKMVGVLIEAMKDQQAMIETLTAKVETLERNFNSRL